MANLLKLILDSNAREVGKLHGVVTQTNELEARYKALSDDDLRDTTRLMRERLDKGEGLDSLIPEAFAAVREAARRNVEMRHFDVQLMGGLVLHQGRIAEMRTGEGKTLVATGPLFTNALVGKGAHLVTVNPYLARRDATWMGKIFHALGMTVGILQHEASYQYDPDFESGDAHWPHIRPIERKEAYACDITYGMNSEFAFDYLRDNMAREIEQCVQRGHHFAIVDEVDSILIDEARTPHIISGEGVGDVSLYQQVDRAVARLKDEEDFTLDEKGKNASLTEDGTHRVEKILGVHNLADPEMHEMMHHVQASLKARFVYRRDVDYVVKDGEVIIVDEFTGRLMPGRRWSDGLHQAVEAKEGVSVQQENQTIATITIQNFFRLYEKLGGMTGTAKTEEGEFRKIYGLDVVSIPTNVQIQRKDYPDIVFKSSEMKFRGVTEEILRCSINQQPVLVGTRSIEISERLSRRLAPDRLQLLAAISLLRYRIEADKALTAEMRKEFHDFLNRPFHDPLDDLPPGYRMVLGPNGEVPEGLELPVVNTGPRVREIRDLATMATKVTPKVNLNLLTPENLKECAEIFQLSGQEEALAECFKSGIVHEVLNAKNHEREAAIIAEAGRLGAVTIATNMAGRGVDILLGGRDNPNSKEEAKAVRERGGLHIIGSERHESRRIDNQLRGRAGRQGDPGSTRYFVSLEDELWRLFGDRTKSFGMQWWDEWQPIDSKLVSRMIERTQKKVEMYHFDIRKHTLQYDEVLNDQRTIIYKERTKILMGADLRENIESYIGELINQEVDRLCPTEVQQDDWDYKGLWASLNEYFPLSIHSPDKTGGDLKGKTHDELVHYLLDIALTEYAAKDEEIGAEQLREFERFFALKFITDKWMEHLDAMDYLREGIGLRGYGQVDPVMAYRKEGANYFDQLVNSWKRDLVVVVFRISIQEQQRPPMPVERPMRMRENMSGEDGYDPVTEMSRGTVGRAPAPPRSAGPARPAGPAGPPRPAGPAGPAGPGAPARPAGSSPSEGASADGAGAVRPRPPAEAPRVSPRARVDRVEGGTEKVGRNDPCPCGSGKKYKKCHLITDTAEVGL